LILKKTLKIAVRELVAYGLRSGDLNFEFSSSTRPLEAIHIHQNIQRSRPPNYQPEVAVSHQIDTELLTLIIGGRIDGIYPDASPVLIEEIKSTSLSLDNFEHNENANHWGQVKCYAYMYAESHGLDEIDTQLTYYQVDTAEIRKFSRHHNIHDLGLFFQNLISKYLGWAEIIVNWESQRDVSIHRLKFPYTSYRQGQREMAVSVYRTIKDGRQLLIQAATGIGKTMAAVFPAIKAIAEGISSKIFYLTARTTGRITAEKALDHLRQEKLRLKSLTITAKDKICFNVDAACSPEECEYARGHFDRVNDAIQDIFTKDAFTRPVIEQIAKTYRICPFEFSLELSLSADCIICDYNYAFDPRVFLRRFFLEEGGAYTFLIDEAHNLVDRSREMFSAEIFKQPLLDVRRAIRGELPRIHKSLGKINAWMVEARRKCEEFGPAYHEKAPPHDLFPLLRGCLLVTQSWLTRNIKTVYREELLDLYFQISGFLRVAEQFDESYVTCIEKINKDLKLKLFCIDPSIQLKRALKRCKAAIFFSATMTPMAYFQQILGCAADAAHLMLPSPFPVENLRLLISDNISTLYRQREHTKNRITRTIRTLVEQKKGNYLVYFPSYEYLQMVYDIYTTDEAEIDHIRQTPSMSETDRIAFLQLFKQDNPRSLVGFAVMGGVFGEGIDLVGERLSGAIIVGVGLPGISLERELIREYFSESINAGFEFAYQYPGINRVLQAAGRVIRSEEDRGVVLLVDQRYSTSRYRSLLLRQWPTIQVRHERKLAEALRIFWKQSE
jgi:DNA excision repair protein ERCC-2